MDPIMIEKLKAMKSNSMKTAQFLQSLFKLFLTTLCLGLFLSSPLWLPLIFSFLNIFLATIFEPKGLFIVCNVIIVILFGQYSKLSMSSPSCDIYEEYVSRNKRLQRLNGTSDQDQEDKEVVEERQEITRDEEEEGDNYGLDELNKRVEDFIARVNKQRRIEARMDYCEYGGEEICKIRIRENIYTNCFRDGSKV